MISRVPQKFKTLLIIAHYILPTILLYLYLRVIKTLDLIVTKTQFCEVTKKNSDFSAILVFLVKPYSDLFIAIHKSK